MNIGQDCLLNIELLLTGDHLTGFPIPNDPIYSGSVWGPNRGKGGDFGKSEEQVYNCIKCFCFHCMFTIQAVSASTLLLGNRNFIQCVSSFPTTVHKS